jgi:hypothetical protein
MVLLVVVVWILALGQVVWSWSNYVNISQNEGNSYRPAVAIDSAKTIHIAWSDNSLNYPGNSEILYRTSSDGGVTWSAIQNVSNSASASIQPVIAAAGPNAVAVGWIDGGKMHARVWNGTNWSPAAQLSTSVQPTQRLSITINQSGIALAAWSEGAAVELYGSGGPPPQGYLYSRWNGTAWSTPIPQTGRLAAMRGNLAYLATSQRTLLRSTDSGATWGNPISLPQGYIVPDDMKIDSLNRLRMAWLGPTQNAVYAATYNGQTFSAITTVSSGGDPNPYKQLSLAINKDDQLALIWTKNSLVPSSAYSGAVRRALQVLASQSIDGQSWTTSASPVADSGCFATVAGSPIDTHFYGAWQSPNCFTGQVTDIYFAVQNAIVQSVSSNLSSIAATPATAPADGTTAMTITVTLWDDTNRPVTGKTVLLAGARGSLDIITQPSLPTNDKGQTVGSISSTSSGSTSVSAIDISDNVRVAVPATVTFTTLTITPNEKLRRQILLTDRYARDDLSSLAKVVTQAGDDGDYFVNAVTEDRVKLAIDLMLGVSKGIGNVKETVDAARPAVYVTYPGVASEEGWSAILRFQRAFPISGKLFDAAVRQGVQNNDWSGMSLTVLKGGIKYYAAGLFSAVAKSQGESAATKLFGKLAGSHGGMKTIAKFAAGGMSDQQQMLQSERAQLLDSIPPMDDARQNNFAYDLSQRSLATIVEGAAYRRHAILLSSLRGAHDTIGNSGVLGAVLRFTASSMAGAAFDGPGKLVVDGLTSSFDTYINARKLNEAQRGVVEAVSVLKGAPEAAARIYSNTTTGYAQIQRNHPATLIRGHIGAIHNYIQGSGAGPLWFEHNSYSDVEVFNDSNVTATFEVFANFGYNNRIFFNLFPYAYLPLVKTAIVRIGPHTSVTARVYYREEERDGSPDNGSDVQFDVLATSDNGDSTFFVDSEATTWLNPQPAAMSASASVAESAASNQIIVENPISSYVLSDPATQTYQVQLWLTNPFTATITADITQPLPAGLSVITTDGMINGGTITWHRTIAASGIVSATFDFRTTDAAGTKLSSPAAMMAFVEPLTGQSVTAASNSPSFTTSWPVALDTTVPLGRVGAGATMPVTITNFLATSVSGTLMTTLDGAGSAHTVVSQPFSVLGRATTTAVIRLPTVVQPGIYRLTIALQLSGAHPLTQNEVYEVHGQFVYLPFVTRHL